MDIQTNKNKVAKILRFNRHLDSLKCSISIELSKKLLEIEKLRETRRRYLALKDNLCKFSEHQAERDFDVKRRLVGAEFLEVTISEIHLLNREIEEAKEKYEKSKKRLESVILKIRSSDALMDREKKRLNKYVERNEQSKSDDMFLQNRHKNEPSSYD